MKKFFNHIFFRMYWWNESILKRKGTHLFSAIIGLSAIHVLNYTTIVFSFFLYIIKNPLAYPMWIQIAAMILILIATYLAYSRNDYYKEIVAKAKKEKKSELMYLDIGMVFYIIISIIVHIFIVIKSRELVVFQS